MRRRRLVAIVVVLAAGLGLWAGRAPLLTAAGLWLNVGRPLRTPVDIVVVLGGGADTRPVVAAEILRAGFARAVLVTDAPQDPHSADDRLPTDYELNVGMLVSEGVVPEQLQRLTVAVASTRGEAAALGEYLRAHPGERLAIVTTDYHTRRARLLITRESETAESDRVTFVSVPTDEYGPSDWWTSENGIQAYLLEFIKLSKDAVGF